MYLIHKNLLIGLLFSVCLRLTTTRLTFILDRVDKPELQPPLWEIVGTSKVDQLRTKGKVQATDYRGPLQSTTRHTRLSLPYDHLQILTEKLPFLGLDVVKGTTLMSAVPNRTRWLYYSNLLLNPFTHAIGRNSC